MFRCSCRMLLFALFTGIFVVPAVAAPDKPVAPAGPEPKCRAELLVEPTTGEVLYEHNAQEPLPPASMVKLMVAYVTLKKVKEGTVKLGDTVTASAFASKVGGSQVYLKQGEQFTLAQLLEAVLIQSANDASVAIAEHIGGSQEGFVEIMNAEAKVLGMNTSQFHTAHGLPPGKGQQPDLVSAYDFSLLSRALLREFPHVLDYTGKGSADFRGGAFVMTNHNHLLRSFQGCDGLKTGYYREAGFCVTVTALRNGIRMLATLMGCEDRKARDAEAARLLSKGFAQYRTVNLIERGAPSSASVAVANGIKPTIVPVAASELKAVVKAGDEQKVTQKSAACRELRAPVAENTPCGSVSFHLGEREIGRVGLVVSEPIPEINTIGKVKRYLGL